jgi:hypothetical protein
MTARVINVPPDVAAVIRKPVEGQGGFQELIRRLQEQLDCNDALTLTDEDIERIQRYQSYEPGGFEDRLAPLLKLLQEQGLIQ